MAKHRGGGVSKSGDRWRARLRVGGSTVSLGYFATEEEAEAILQAALSDIDGGAVISPTMRLGEWGEQVLDRREIRGVAGVDQERSCWRKHVGKHAIAELPL